MDKKQEQARVDLLWMKMERLTEDIERLEDVYYGLKDLPAKGTKGWQWFRGEGELSYKQRRFTEEFPKDLNGTAAARRAGYSKNGASQTAYDLLHTQKIVNALKDEFRKISHRNQISQDRVIKEIAYLAYSNIKDFMSWKSNEIDMTDSEFIPRAMASAIKEISTTVNKEGRRNMKFKLYDKGGMMMFLAKYVGLFDEDEVVKHPGMTKSGRVNPEGVAKIATKVRNALSDMIGSVPPSPKGPLAAETSHVMKSAIDRATNRLKEIEGNV